MPDPKPRISRRQFAGNVALGAAATTAAAAGPGEQTQPKPADSPDEAPGNDESTTAEEEQEQPQLPTEDQLLTALILTRYADERMTPEIVAEIHREVRGDLFRSRVLSTYPLANSDEPAFAFAAWRADDE